MAMTDPNFYVSMSKEDRKMFDADTRNIANVIQKIDKITKEVNSSGLPWQSML